jgi:CDP-diacylglycerol---serine O-phosphatidyltransferase
MIQNSKNPWYGFVPNLFTSLNLVCGVIAAYLALQGKIKSAFILMAIAAFFDFIDGFAARLLKVSGDFGKELDSLADNISFGLLPGAMLFFVLKAHFPEFSGAGQLNLIQWILLLSPILIPVFSALRLAKFNIDVRQKEEFIGLPTPANALFFAALCYTFLYMPDHFLSKLNQPVIIAVVILLFSYLLVAEIPLFALKFKSFRWKENTIRFVFLIISILLLAIFRIPGLVGVILLYILLSVMRNLKNGRGRFKGISKSV